MEGNAGARLMDGRTTADQQMTRTSEDNGLQERASWKTQKIDARKMGDEHWKCHKLQRARRYITKAPDAGTKDGNAKGWGEWAIHGGEGLVADGQEKKGAASRS